MEKITLEQFKDWSSNKIGVLIRTKEDLEVFKNFADEGSHGDFIRESDFPIVIDYEYHSLGSSQLSNSKAYLEEYLTADLIVSVNKLEMPIKYYNGEIILTRLGRDFNSNFTEGKIYKIVEGVLIDDRGAEWHNHFTDGHLIEDLEQLNKVINEYDRPLKAIEVVR